MTFFPSRCSVSMVSLGVSHRSMSNISTSGVTEVALESSSMFDCRMICQVSFTLGVQRSLPVGVGKGASVTVGVLSSSPLSRPSVSPRPSPNARPRTTTAAMVPMTIFRRSDHARDVGFLSISIVCGAIRESQQKCGDQNVVYWAEGHAKRKEIQKRKEIE